MSEKQSKCNIMKKLFGELNITWKRLILFAIIIGIYTGIVALLPCTTDTSFYEDNIETYMINAEFKKTGNTEFTITSPDGIEYVYKIKIERSSYERERIK